MFKVGAKSMVSAACFGAVLLVSNARAQSWSDLVKRAAKAVNNAEHAPPPQSQSPAAGGPSSGSTTSKPAEKTRKSDVFTNLKSGYIGTYEKQVRTKVAGASTSTLLVLKVLAANADETQLKMTLTLGAQSIKKGCADGDTYCVPLSGTSSLVKTIYMMYTDKDDPNCTFTVVFAGATSSSANISAFNCGSEFGSGNMSLAYMVNGTFKRVSKVD